MTYATISDLHLDNIQSDHSSSGAKSNYRPQMQFNKNHAINAHRNFKGCSNSWKHVSSVPSQRIYAYRNSQITLNSDWQNLARAPRRFSHSVDTAPFLVNQSVYSNSSNSIFSKYSAGSSCHKRTISQPDFQPPLRSNQLKTLNHDQYRLPAYGFSKCFNGLGSTSELNKSSPKRDSPLYFGRYYYHSKNFRNSSEGPLSVKECQKKLKEKPDHRSPTDEIDQTVKNHHKYPYYDLSKDDEIRKGDILKNRYEIVHKIGSGSFGNVYKAVDTENGEFCAVKCIKHISNFKKLAEEEISMLKMLSDQDSDDIYNFLHLNDHFKTPDYTYMVFDLLSINLYQLVHRNNYRGFATKLVRKFVRCILNCLNFLHRNKIIHCDLKPENILLERPGYTNVKVIDFGSSCRVGQNAFSYIQSRFYRAPEVIFGCGYDTPIDMWSLGCIAVELLTGSPVFPGENEQDQIACVMEVLGLPPCSVMRKIRRPQHFFTDEGEPRYLAEQNERTEHKGYHKSTRMNRAYPGTLTLKVLLKNSMGEEGLDPRLIDFLSRCLCWDPIERMTAQEALRHPWVCETEMPNSGPDAASREGSPSSVEE